MGDEGTDDAVDEVDVEDVLRVVPMPDEFVLEQSLQLLLLLVVLVFTTGLDSLCCLKVSCDTEVVEHFNAVDKDSDDDDDDDEVVVVLLFVDADADAVVVLTAVVPPPANAVVIAVFCTTSMCCCLFCNGFCCDVLLAELAAATAVEYF